MKNLNYLYFNKLVVNNSGKINHFPACQSC